MTFLQHIQITISGLIVSYFFLGQKLHRTYLGGSLCLVAERKDHLEHPRRRPPSNHETFDRSKIEKERERGNQEISFGKVDDSICDTRGFLSSADSGCTWKLGRQKVKQEVGRGNQIFIIKRKIEHHEGNNWSLPIHLFRVIDWNFSLHCTRKFAPPSWYGTGQQALYPFLEYWYILKRDI